MTADMPVSYHWIVTLEGSDGTGLVRISMRGTNNFPPMKLELAIDKVLASAERRMRQQVPSLADGPLAIAFFYLQPDDLMTRREPAAQMTRAR